MKVRLKDIAEIANVSTATVSIILNNPEAERFSEQTKEKVLRIAKELNYTPNLVAKSLVSKKSNTIGLIIPDLENPFFSTLAKILEAELRKQNYTLIMVNTNEDFRNDGELITFLNNRGVDGILMALSSNTYGNEEGIIKILENLSIPFVLIDRSLEKFESNQVIFNNKLGEYLATNYVIEMGHKKIGYISVKVESLSGFYRHLGFEKALKENGLEVNEDLIKYGSYDFNTGYNLSKDLIDKGVTAIICANDLIAYGVMKCVKEMNLRIPEDISVVGYDNLEIANLLGVNLTTINQDINKLAQEAIKILFKSIEGSSKLEKIVLQPSLVIRDSVKEI